MIGIPEAFVATPLGVLRVWATSEHIVRAATLPGWVKTRPAYRDDPQAQRCAELVTIDQVNYTLRLWLHSTEWSGGRGAWATHRGWVLPRGAVELARGSGLAPVPAAGRRSNGTLPWSAARSPRCKPCGPGSASTTSSSSAASATTPPRAGEAGRDGA